MASRIEIDVEHCGVSIGMWVTDVVCIQTYICIDT